MSVTSEIKNKERALAELMAKILKEPLNPLESSLKKLNTEVLETKDKVEKINDAINAVGANTEDLIEPLKKSLCELQDDYIPEAISTLREFISTLVEEKRQDISAALSQQSAHYDSQLKAATGEVFEKLSDVLGQQNESVQSAIQQYQQTGIDSAEALLQQLLAANRFLEEASVASASEQQSTRERDQRLAERLESVMQAQQALTEAVSEQKIQLEAQVAASQGRFRYVAIIFALFSTSTLAYIGYDIWKNLVP